MTFPITHIKATNLELTDALRTLVEQKFDTLEKFIGNETDVSCDIELEKMTNSQNGNIFRAEANLFLRGKLYRAEATTDQIEKSIDEVPDELARELQKSQSRTKTLVKKGGAMFKRMMQFGR